MLSSKRSVKVEILGSHDGEQRDVDQELVGTAIARFSFWTQLFVYQFRKYRARLRRNLSRPCQVLMTSQYQLKTLVVIPCPLLYAEIMLKFRIPVSSTC